MGKMSRVKGANFERYMAKDLSQVYYGDETTLRRTPLSGGWGAKYAGGDIAGPENFPLYIECRNRECWNTKDLFNCGSILYKWYNEVCEKALYYKKVPILIFTHNFENVYVLTMEAYTVSKYLKVLCTETVLYIYTYDDWKHAKAEELRSSKAV